MDKLIDLVYWIFGLSIVVLIVMNAGGFAQAVSSISSFVTGESAILSGSGYGGKTSGTTAVTSAHVRRGG
jgi:hypothetical protein